jgi:capsid protein
LTAAKATAAPAVAVISELNGSTTTADGEQVTDIPAGATVYLRPGEDIKAIENKRPNQLIEQFIGAMIGSIAAATRVARKWIDKDYSGATYMNVRMEQLDATRQQRPVQQWMGRQIASAPYERVLPWILMRLGIEMPADPVARRLLFRHKVMADIPEYVDPLVDGEAAIQNMSGNLTTLQEECGKRGKDWRRVLAQRAVEREEKLRLGLIDVQPAANPAQQPAENEAAND